MLDRSELYLLLIRLQSITRLLTHVTWGQASLIKVCVLLLKYTLVWLFWSVVVVAGIDIVPSEYSKILLENLKYLCKPAPKLKTGV